MSLPPLINMHIASPRQPCRFKPSRLLPFSLHHQQNLKAMPFSPSLSKAVSFPFVSFDTPHDSFTCDFHVFLSLVHCLLFLVFWTCLCFLCLALTSSCLYKTHFTSLLDLSLPPFLCWFLASLLDLLPSFFLFLIDF